MADVRRALFVVAHPDDEVKFSGTVALQARAGIEVTIAVALNGNLGGLMGAAPQERAETRHREMQQACQILGAKLEWLDYGDDDFMDRLHNEYGQVEMTFRNLLRRVDPQLLVIPPPYDYHHHHNKVSELVLNASINASNVNRESDYPPSSMIPYTLYCRPQMGIGFVPSMYVDITDTYHLKIDAMEAHQSQHQYLKDHHRIDICQNVETMARYYGAACGVEFAEPFALCHKFNRPGPIQELATFFAV